MQTFLPSEDFALSARLLDRQRLGKQRVEAKQILIALNVGGGWRNHPAVRMWRGYETALAQYGVAICNEWISRGYRDSLLIQFQYAGDGSLVFPSWLGDIDFHLSHQSNLVRKDPAHYGPLFPGVPDDLPYVWPVS